MSVVVLQKVQRNGLAVDLEDEPKAAENQNQSESPDPAGGKSDKVRKQSRRSVRVRFSSTSHADALRSRGTGAGPMRCGAVRYVSGGCVRRGTLT